MDGQSQLPLEMAQIQCVIAAAVHYEVPANVLLAVAEQERGRVNTWVRNANGSHDVGVMQFNTTYLNQLNRYGIRPEHVASEGCYAFLLAAWRIKGHLVNDTGGFWTRVANFHSRTPYYNQRYAASVAARANRWATWIEARYPTRMIDPKDVTQRTPAKLQK